MGRKLHPGRILYDLKSIKGYFNCVPKDVAPDEDKGIYFTKAMTFLDGLIREYELKVEKHTEEIRKKNLKSKTKQQNAEGIKLEV